MPKSSSAKISSKKLCSHTKIIIIDFTLTQSQPLFSQKQNLLYFKFDIFLAKKKMSNSSSSLPLLFPFLKKAKKSILHHIYLNHAIVKP